MVIMVSTSWTGFLLKLNYPAFYGLAVGVNLTKRLTEREEMFEKRFQSTFHLQDKVYFKF